MADCKDLDLAIKRLEAAINQQNQCCEDSKKQIANLKDRVRKLEQGLGKVGQESEPVDLSPIYARLAKIENYIQKLDSAGQKIKSLIPEIQKEVIDFIQMLIEAWLTNFVTGK